MTKYFANFTDPIGTFMDWVEIDGAAHSRLCAGGLVVLTKRGMAIYRGQGTMNDEETGERNFWVQLVDVPMFALIGSPIDPDAVASLVELNEGSPQEVPALPTERARQIAERIIGGITVEGFENDADAANVLNGQLDAVAKVIEKALLT